MERGYVNFIVGGMYYCMQLADIQKHPESFFNKIIKKEWNPELDAPITIARDGNIFQHIVEFHRQGESFLSKKATAGLVRHIQAEGDYYNLTSLVEVCEKYVVSCIGTNFNRQNINCKYCSEDKDDIVNVVSATWAPFCLEDSRLFNHDCPILKSSSLWSLNIQELCEATVRAPFGKGNESLIDTSVRDALEISADQLNPKLWKEFRADMYPLYKLAPRMKLTLRPYKLVIYKEGGHFTEHRDSVRGENHIGTLVQILESEFTGGELIVRQNDTEMSINEPGEWIAMYGDALHRIEPVTSGTRVALIFDLINVGVPSEYDLFGDSERISDPVPDVDWAHEVDSTTRDNICTALDKELKKYEEVVICLTHLYPVCQADPARLKGGDLVLYQLLAEQESKYDVSILPVKVKSSIDRGDSSSCYLAGALVDLDFEISKTVTKRVPKSGSMLLVIPRHCASNHVLSYSKYIEHVGNEPQAEETMYLVTGFRITKHTVEDSHSNSRAGEKRTLPKVADGVVKKATRD